MQMLDYGLLESPGGAYIRGALHIVYCVFLEFLWVLLFSEHAHLWVQFEGRTSESALDAQYLFLLLGFVVVS